MTDEPDDILKEMRRATAQLKYARQDLNRSGTAVMAAHFAAEAVVIVARAVEKTQANPVLTTRLLELLNRLEEDYGFEKGALESVTRRLREEAFQTRDMRRETGGPRRGD